MTVPVFNENMLLNVVHDLTVLIEAKCVQCKGSMTAAAECRDTVCALRSYGPRMVQSSIALHGREYIQPGGKPEVLQ